MSSNFNDSIKDRGFSATSPTGYINQNDVSGFQQRLDGQRFPREEKNIQAFTDRIKDLSPAEKLAAIQTEVNRRIKYVPEDKEQNETFNVNDVAEKKFKGDCEDHVAYAKELCLRAGFQPDKVSLLGAQVEYTTDGGKSSGFVGHAVLLVEQDGKTMVLDKNLQGVSVYDAKTGQYTGKLADDFDKPGYAKPGTPVNIGVKEPLYNITANGKGTEYNFTPDTMTPEVIKEREAADAALAKERESKEKAAAPQQPPAQPAPVEAAPEEKKPVSPTFNAAAPKQSGPEPAAATPVQPQKTTEPSATAPAAEPAKPQPPDPATLQGVTNTGEKPGSLAAPPADKPEPVAADAPSEKSAPAAEKPAAAPATPASP